MELNTPRLILRDYTKEEGGIFHNFRINPDINKYMHWHDLSIEASDRIFAEFISDMMARERRYYHFLLIKKSTKNPIGEAGLNISKKNESGGTAELGYLLEKEYWNQGYATEATQEVIKFGFTKLGLHKISAHLERRNEHSARLLERIGMEKVCLLEKEAFIENKWEDILIYSILK